MFEILEKKSLNPFVTMMKINAPRVAKKAEPGQFIILRTDSEGERIPLTIADFDREKGTVSIIFQIVGATTEKLNHMNVGDFLSDFTGPLGKATETAGLKKVAVVGGGVGCAIAYPVAKKLHETGVEVHVIAGFRNKELVILEDEFKAASSKLVIMSDDGSIGEKALVTKPLMEAIEKKRPDLIMACGPTPMLRAVPATIRMAASTEAAFRSGIFRRAISSTCALVIEATLSRFGRPDALSIPAAFLISTAAGGVLVMNVKERS